MTRKLLQGLAIGLASATLAWGLWLGGLLQWLEYPSWDWRARISAAPGAATPQIRIILLDQTSLDWGRDEQDWPWPWPRVAYGAIGEFCRQGGAKAVVFDFLFTEPSIWNRIYGDDDGAFGVTLATAGGSVAGIQLSRSQGTATQWPDALAKPLPAGVMEDGLPGSWTSRVTFSKAAFPVPEIATNCVLVGGVFTEPDSDGRVRRIPPVTFFNTIPVPALGLAASLAASPQPVALQARSCRVGDHIVPLDATGQAILRYRGRSQTHRTVSAQAVIQSQVRLSEGSGTPVLQPEFFRDAYVLVGSSAPGLLDIKSAPISGTYPGVEIHATFLDNLLSGDFIREMSHPAALAWVLGLAILAGLAGRSCQNGWHAALGFAVLLPLPLLPGLMAYRQGLWMPLAPVEVAIAVSLVTAMVVNYALEGRQKRFIKHAFRQYLSPHVIERLVRNPDSLRLGGETRELSIYFSDIQGFTTISESLTPDRLTGLLNEYLTAMTDIIMEEGGTVDKYEGDAVIAFWNAPLDLPGHAVCAVRSALRCQSKITAMQADLKARYGVQIVARIGLNTGKVVIGNMGSSQRFNYTFLGDAGNLASRLEGTNKQFGTRILISQFTHDKLGDAFPSREISRVRVVGRKEPVRVYEPVLPETLAARAAVFAAFATGLQAYYDGRFQEALDAFLSHAEEDPPAQSYVRRCRELLDQPPPAWDGVWELHEK